jgi:hypothetical protein
MKYNAEDLFIFLSLILLIILVRIMWRGFNII